MDAYSAFVDELRSDLESKENRIRFLEHSLLSLLLNQKFYNMLQQDFHTILDKYEDLTTYALCAMIFSNITEKELLLGPDAINADTLEMSTSTLQNNILSYILTVRR